MQKLISHSLHSSFSCFASPISRNISTSIALCDHRQRVQQRRDRLELSTSRVEADIPFERHEDVKGTDEERKKRKAAIFIAYIGTGYSGSQIVYPRAPNEEAPKTIENELQRALYQAGLISPSNFGDLLKIGWSRSSRTDKGVHSLKTVVAAKLQFSPAELALSPLPFSQIIIPRINHFLPHSIKAIGIQRVPKSWNARHQCQGREYSYWIPWSILEKSKYSLAEIQEIIQQFEGTHEWKELSGNSDFYIGRGDKEEGNEVDTIKEETVEMERNREDDEEDSEGEEGMEEEEEEEEETMEMEEEVSKIGDIKKRNFKWSYAEQLRRKPEAKYRRTIRKMTVSPTPVPLVLPDGSQEQWVEFTLTGDSFLPYQIRKMMALTLGVVLGHLPPLAIALAVGTTLHIPLPLAPPFYLFLSDNTFFSDKGKKSDKTFSFQEDSKVKILQKDFKEKTLLPHISSLGKKTLEEFVERWLPLVKINDWREIREAVEEWERQLPTKQKRPR